MPIEHGAHGTTTITGDDGHNVFRLAALKQALKLQAIGIKVMRGRSAVQAANGMGFAGRTVKKVLPQVEAALIEAQRVCVHIDA
jgi:hypothetical protein